MTVRIVCDVLDDTRCFFISLTTSSPPVKGAPESQHCLKGQVPQHGMVHEVTVQAYAYVASTSHGKNLTNMELVQGKREW